MENIKHSPETTTMRTRRPLALNRLILDEYLYRIEEGPIYRSNGEGDSYTFGEHCTKKLIDHYRCQSPAPVSSLDIGTGHGAFLGWDVWEPGDNLQAITAHDYREYGSLVAKDDPRYIVANAEHLESIPGLLETYDIVLSKHTLRHFADPIAGLEQVANKVAPKGLLCIDDFGNPSSMVYSKISSDVIYKGLIDGGFTPLPIAFESFFGLQPWRQHFFPGIIAIRSEFVKPVRIQIGYQGIGDNWSYEPL